MGISANTSGYATIEAIKASGSLAGDIVLNPGNGNVGIGTSTPSARLQIAGDTRIGIENPPTSGGYPSNVNF